MRVVLGDVGGDAAIATLPDESTGVVGLVGAERARPDTLAGLTLEHLDGISPTFSQLVEG